MTLERERVADIDSDWRRWGPYLSERQWGTVREDYSPSGEAWEFVDHEASRKRAYRWGEDGIAGFSDDQQLLCFGLALWNGRDPILKERLFGLTGNEGNHGEDVKEHYYYLDATPSHSYLKMLYKYPQQEFPYGKLSSTNRSAGKDKDEFELLDSGVFDEDRYFDVFVEYVKATPFDTLIRITIHNRGPEVAEIDLLPTLWFRNTWSWGRDDRKPSVELKSDGEVIAKQHELGEYSFSCRESSDFLFTENETDPASFGMKASGYYKDAFHEHVVDGKADAINPDKTGTKTAAHIKVSIEAGGKKVLDYRLSRTDQGVSQPFDDFDKLFETGLSGADEFYATVQSKIKSDDEKNIQRQALAGMIWTKQFYNLNIREWLQGDPSQPAPPESRKSGRNSEWIHLNNSDVISMPDKWEYPWYAAWDLAFHCVPFALVDPAFAKNQLVLMTREWYMHPNGQIPAYEWAFGDVNPPVHAWASWRIYQMEQKQTGKGDRAFLESIFHKLLLNFTWWVNQKDEDNRNVFQGGFLGLDNIGVFDRSSPLEDGGHIDQADGTSWMAMYSLNMLRISLELAIENPVYENIATKFLEHFLYIADAMTDIGGTGDGLWDEEDQFYYDKLHLPTGRLVALKVRSLVGLSPLFAVEVLDEELLKKTPRFKARMDWFFENRPDLAKLVSRWHEPGDGQTRLFSLLRGHRMKALLKRMLDETEFFSDYGVRAISKFHEEHPYTLNCDGSMETCDGGQASVKYEPAESRTTMFGGNSNWRGPIWFPMNFLLIESLKKFHDYYGDEFKIECPVGSGTMLTISEAADEVSRRLIAIFANDGAGQRPVFNKYPKMRDDPHFKDHILFYEYFHGDNGRGVGASHQTGWTALVASLIDEQSSS